MSAIPEEPAAQLVALDGLDAVDWAGLRQAGGTAEAVPDDLRQLTSADPDRREEALTSLSGSIYHQGTLYSATAAATPFLVRLLCEATLPDRDSIAGLLRSIAVSCTEDPRRIAHTWAERKASSGEIFSAPTEELARLELAANMETSEALLTSLFELLEITQDEAEDATVRAEVQTIILRFAQRLPALRSFLSVEE